MNQVVMFFNSGGWVMYPLLICSFLTGAIVLERSVFWWMNKRNAALSLRSLKLLSIEQLNDLAIDITRFDKMHFSTEIINIYVLYSNTTKNNKLENSVLKDQGAHLDDLKEVLLMQGNIEIDNSKVRLSVLETIVMIAPILGILGTVTGIITTFKALSLQDPSMVGLGLSEALITTAFGLVIALFAQIPLICFEHQTEKLTEKLNQIIICLVNPLLGKQVA